MRRILPDSAGEEPDIRPALFAIISLMLLLLPLLLFATSPQKLTALSLALALPGEVPQRSGVIERVTIRVTQGSARVSAEVRKTDVLAGQGDVERRLFEVPGRANGLDYAGIQDALGALRALDPEGQQSRAILLPDDSVPTRVVVALLDAIRSRDGQQLFPDVILGDPNLEAP